MIAQKEAYSQNSPPYEYGILPPVQYNERSFNADRLFLMASDRFFFLRELSSLDGARIMMSYSVK